MSREPNEKRDFLMALEPGCRAPEAAHPGDAGLDLLAREEAWIAPGGRELVPTGLRLSIPEDCVAYVCSRSGLALRSGVFVLNAPGVVDSGYRGEVGVILCNSGRDTYYVAPGDKVAQLVVQRIVLPSWEVVESLDGSYRGAAGFGSTGA